MGNWVLQPAVVTQVCETMSDEDIFEALSKPDNNVLKLFHQSQHMHTIQINYMVGPNRYLFALKLSGEWQYVHVLHEDYDGDTEIHQLSRLLTDFLATIEIAENPYLTRLRENYWRHPAIEQYNHPPLVLK